MTVEWFDLAQRLHAARHGHVVPRLAHAPVPRIHRPVAVRARRHRPSVTVTATAPDTRPATARDTDALALLSDLGVRLSAPTWRTLVTDDPATLPALAHLARRAPHDGPAGDTAAHVAWWADRGDFPGTSAVVPLLDACRTRWITGADPGAERDPATWRTWLRVGDDGCAGLLTLLDLVQDGPVLPLLASVTEDDTWSWGKAASEYADDWDWRRPDTPARAATGLRARCDAADLHAAALLTDPLYRRRAVHTGHVVPAHAAPAAGQGDHQAGRSGLRRLDLICARLDARLRGGEAVNGWIGAPDDDPAQRFHGAVTATAVTAGRLVLSLGQVGGDPPNPGQPVTLIPAPPNPHTLRDGRRRYSRLYNARRSWLTTGRTPTPARRDVPLEVMIAAAD